MLWLGTPCTTFTSMQNLRSGGPLRSSAAPWGVEGLPAHQQANIIAGNIFLRFSMSLLAICRRLHIIAVMENPHTSMIWHNPLVVKARGWREAREFVVDFCRYGTPWRKRTRLLALHCDLSASSVRCEGVRGCCSETQRPHERLMGRRPGEKIDRTKLAESYPVKWTRALVADLCLALRDQDLEPLRRHLG